jgi:hypothetical protein
MKENVKKLHRLFYPLLLLGLLTGFLSPLQAHSEENFDIWMGSKTKHWAHVKQEKDLADLEKFRSLFRKNAPLVETAQGLLKIPKVVHFIWLGPRPFPPQSVSNVRSWIAKNPGWTFKFWTDRPRDPPCHGMEAIVIKEYPFQLLKHCYATSENWGEKSDILRFEILNSEGGVYVDHDASCLKPFEPYHQAYDFFCGLETPHPPFVGRHITAGNGVIGSRPGHPVIQRVIQLIDHRWQPILEKFLNNLSLPRSQIVMERTYIALTDALATAVDLPGNVDIVFPASYFFPKKGLKPILSEHFFANSWAGGIPPDKKFEKEFQRSIEKTEKKFNSIIVFQLLAFTVNLLLLGFGLYYARIRSKKLGKSE